MQRLTQLLMTTAIVLAPFAASAAEPADGFKLEEITVTARKLAENLQTTPVSVTVVSNKTLESLSMNNIGEIQNVTPNLQYMSGFSGSSSGANFFIRGIGQLDFISTSDPGVATFIDGVYMARTVGAALDTADIERIEVLKGPQGTLFGKNTIGGAINITTAKPGPDLKGYAEATVGNFGRYDGRFMANVPITDKFYLKLNAVTRNNDGFMTRVVDGVKLGDDKNVGGNLQARFVPNENLDIILSADVTRRRAHIAAHTGTAITQTGLTDAYLAITGVDPLSYQPLPDTWKTSNTGVRPTDHLNVFGTSLTVNYSLDDFAVKSISAYREMKSESATDFDGTPIPYNDQLVNQNQKQYSQEFQLSQQTERFKWVLGAYYLHEDILEGIQNNFAAFYLPPTNATPGDGPLSTTDLSSDNFAVFGQGSFHLTEQFSVTAGLRWTYEKKDVGITGPFGLATGGAPLNVNGEKSWKNWAPRIGVEYQATDDLLVYASLTRGFKSGSFNGRPDRNNSFNPFNPEKVWAYEAGFKSEFFDHRVRLNGSAFLTKYKGIQLVTGARDSNDQLYFPFDNAGDLDIRGFEVELTARPVEALNISAGLGYTDEKWTNIYPIATVNDKTRLPMMSHITGTIRADYTVPLSDFGTATLGANYSYRSSYFVDTGNSQFLKQGGYGTVEASLAIAPDSGTWQIRFWGKNLTNEKYITWAQDLISIGEAHVVSFFGRPREYGATFRVNF